MGEGTSFKKKSPATHTTTMRLFKDGGRSSQAQIASPAEKKNLWGTPPPWLQDVPHEAHRALKYAPGVKQGGALPVCLLTCPLPQQMAVSELEISETPLPCLHQRSLQPIPWDEGLGKKNRELILPSPTPSFGPGKDPSSSPNMICFLFPSFFSLINCQFLCNFSQE